MRLYRTTIYMPFSIQRNLVKNVLVSPNLFVSGTFTIDITGSQITSSILCFFTSEVTDPIFNMGTTSGGTNVIPSTTLIYDPEQSIVNYAYVATYTGTLSGGILPVFTVNSAIVSYTDFETSVFTANVANLGGSPFTACFLKNTKVETPNGPTCIEDLKVGDLVITSTGASVRIKNIGNWQINRKTRNKNGIVYKIPSGRLGAKEDVFVSYHHQIMLDNGRFVKAYRASLPEATIEEIGSFYTLYNIQLENYRVNRMIVGGGVVVESWNGLNPSVDMFVVSIPQKFSRRVRTA